MVVIAVDCDEVLIETMRGVVEFVKETYGHSRLYEDFRHYMVSDNDHIDFTRDEDLKLFDNYFDSHLVESAQPVPGAKEKLLERKEAGHKLVVVTARSETALLITTKQLEKHYPGIFDDVVFAHHYTDKHIPKSQLCRQLNADYLIEDNIDYALDVAECGIQTFLIERPRNARRDEVDPRIIKVKSREDIVI